MRSLVQAGRAGTVLEQMSRWRGDTLANLGSSWLDGTPRALTSMKLRMDNPLTPWLVRALVSVVGLLVVLTIVSASPPLVAASYDTSIYAYDRHGDSVAGPLPESAGATISSAGQRAAGPAERHKGTPLAR
jgi:hypothetical protein